MAATTAIGAARAVTGELAKSILADIIKDQGKSGLTALDNWSKKTDVINGMTTQLNGLTQKQGLLIGFTTFEAPDGARFSYGPYPMGYGKEPVDPLVAMEYSTANFRELGNTVLGKLTKPAGLQVKGTTMYWAFRDPSGKIQLSSLDSHALLSEAMLTQLSVGTQASNASTMPALQKLATQSKMFNEAEDKIREELRSKNLEARIANCRQAMALAEADFKSAMAQRDAALETAKAGQALQTFIQLVNLAGSTANLVAVANAKADYQESAANQAASKYNTGVTTYVEIFKSETTINIQVLPSSPTIAVPKRD